ncbi:MAG: GNAT family N-acetyltransferase [Solirubrobacteraceae bacterium]
MMQTLVPRSLVWATSIDVLPPDRIVERRDGFLVVRSPSNPTHWWGNLLLFDDAPAAGDGERWEGLFARAFGQELRVQHRTFAWDQSGDVRGAADVEFEARGYSLDPNLGLIATPEQIRPHPRANQEVEVRALDPRPGSPDERWWEQVLEIQVAGRDPVRFAGEAPERVFARTRQADLRAMFRAGAGAWYVALDGDQVAGSLGIVVTSGRARYQAVDTAVTHRRRGICSRLLVDAARHAVATYGATRLVIVADPGYHAAGIYESVGFRPVERVCGVCRPPREGP